VHKVFTENKTYYYAHTHNNGEYQATFWGRGNAWGWG